MRRIIVLATLVLSLTASAALAETVRGKVVHPDGKTPYANVAVTLTTGAKAGTVYTGGDGMFYLQRVAPGQYTLTVKSPKATRRLEIVVTPRPYTDLAPVKLQ